MLIRLAQEDDAEQLAQAEYDTAASQEGLLAAKPHEIPVSAFRRTKMVIGTLDLLYKPPIVLHVEQDFVLSLQVILLNT